MYEPAPYLRPLLWFPGLVFGAGTRLRNRLYAAGALKPVRLPRPVLSVGNLTLGGSGKTPVVVHMAQWLADRGFTPALLTRGYGRRPGSRIMVLSPPEGAPPPVDCGDEPALIRRLVPQIWLGIGAQRRLAAEQILRRCHEPVFLLDDGFQHRGLHRDLDLVVIDASQPLRHNRVVPMGTLREPLSSLERAEAVLVNGNDAEVRAQVRRLCAGARVFGCVQRIESLVPLQQWLHGEHSAEPQEAPPPVFLVAAVGNPARFRHDAQEIGLQVKGARFFKDHYRPRAEEWQAAAAAARAAGAAALLVTAKDAIKMTCTPDFPCFVAVQSTRVIETQEFDLMIAQVVGGYR